MRVPPSRRRLVFLSAVLVLGVGAVAASVAGNAIEAGEVRQPRSDRTPQSPNGDDAHKHGAEVVVRRFTSRLEAQNSVRQRESENEAYDVPADGLHAARIAQRFVRAYLEYSGGKLSSHVRFEFSETATPAFAQELLDAPVRVPDGTRPPVERLVRNGLVRRVFSFRTGFSVSVVITQDGEPQVLGLSVVNYRGRWAVSDLGR